MTELPNTKFPKFYLAFTILSLKNYLKYLEQLV